jgi:hypothetical protein
MTEAPRPEAKDYRDTVFLPKTDFPMKAGLPQKEPGILARWQAQDFYAELRNRRRGRHDRPVQPHGMGTKLSCQTRHIGNSISAWWRHRHWWPYPG